MQNYKKSRIWIPIVLIIVILAVGIGVFLNERNNEFKGNGSAEELWNARTQYIGDNSAVGKILSMLPLAQGLEHDHFKLWTDGDERGLEWVLNDKEGLQLTLADKDQMNRNALLLFSLIDNLEEFSIRIQDDIEVFTRQDYDRDWADQVVKGDVRDYAKSPEKLQELMDYSLENLNNIDVEKHREILLSDYEYDGEDLVEGLVYNTEIEAHSYSKERGGFVIVAPKDICKL